MSWIETLGDLVLAPITGPVVLAGALLSDDEDKFGEGESSGGLLDEVTQPIKDIGDGVAEVSRTVRWVAGALAVVVLVGAAIYAAEKVG